MNDNTDRQWYVVKANGRQERLAMFSLRAEQIETYLPLMAKTNKDGDLYGAPLFPGFLFVRLAKGDPAWRQVFSARGVSAVLGNGNRPSPLADRVIREIRSREHDGFVRLGVEAEAAPRFRKGDQVTVHKGPFGAIDAIFVRQVDKHRCEILIRLLGESPRIAKADLASLASASADAIHDPASPPGRAHAA